MSDKPQDTQGDILDEIMGRDPAYRGDAPLEGPEQAPPQSSGLEDSAPVPEMEGGEAAESSKKNRRSAVYIYLLILFGAAFMMLLLAYFIQLRNSETTISDLRDSMNLSRDQLLDEIDELKEQSKEYEKQIQSLEAKYDSKEEELQDMERQAIVSEQTALRKYWEKDMANNLAWLERFCAEGDYLMAATVVAAQDYFFNEYNTNYYQSPPKTLDADLSPLQIARYLELRDEVFDKSGCLAMNQPSDKEDGSDYTEYPVIYGIDTDTMNIAQTLWQIISDYSRGIYSDAATRMADFYTQGDGNNLKRLNSEPFQPSTADVFEQIKADLLDRGMLKEDEDGTLTAPDFYGSETGSTIPTETAQPDPS